MMFTNCRYKQLFINWEFHARGMLARFRSTCGQFIEDSWFIEFINDLKMQSREFDLWWSRHEVQSIDDINKKLKHPIVGTLVFEFCSFDVSDKPNLKMIVNTPLPESDTPTKMKSLLGVKISISQ